MKIVGKAPTEDPQTAIRTLDFPSRERFLFIGGPFDGKRCHVEMTTHGPDNIISIGTLPEPKPGDFMNAQDPADVAITTHRYIRIPLHENEGKIHFVYQHEHDHRNVLAALIESSSKT